MKNYLAIGFLALAACNIKVDTGSSDDSSSDTGSSDNSKKASGETDSATAAPVSNACANDYMVGKEHVNAGQSNGMGSRKLNLNDKCEMSVSNCSQTLKFPENYEIRLDQTIHISMQVEITGVQGWANCMSTGIKTCDVSLVTNAGHSLFALYCNGETVNYAGTY